MSSSSLSSTVSGCLSCRGVGCDWEWDTLPESGKQNKQGKRDLVTVTPAPMTSTSPESENISQQAQDGIKSLADNDVDSVDSNLRYIAYGARLRTALRASSRYIAYVSPRHASLFARSRGRVHTLDQRRWRSLPSRRAPEDRHRRIWHFLDLSDRVNAIT